MRRTELGHTLHRLAEALGRGHTWYAVAAPDTCRTVLGRLASAVWKSDAVHVFLVARRDDGLDVRVLDAHGRPVDTL